MNNDHDYDVIIVGAGPAGLGVALPLLECGVKNLAVLEARTVGAAFDAWPAQMRLITPSFYSNPFFQPDLNAISPHTSPADFTHSEHLTGPQYAAYLRAFAAKFEIPVHEGVRVNSLEKQRRLFSGRDGDRFVLQTSSGKFTARFVIWAAGEFFYPLDDDFDGAEHCLHNTKVRDWNELEGDEFAIIGGYESGVDAAVHLLRRGKTVHLFSRGQPWAEQDTDPSRSLSPYTRDRMREVLKAQTGKLELYSNADVKQVLAYEAGKWAIFDQDDIPFVIGTQPILATGFLGSLVQIIDHYELENCLPVFSEEADESTKTPGLFYCGPLLTHRGSKFCFLYKFRSRFGVVARAIVRRLKADEKPLADYAKHGFLNEDLSCCADCVCAVHSQAEPLGPRARRYAEAAANREESARHRPSSEA